MYVCLYFDRLPVNLAMHSAFISISALWCGLMHMLARGVESVPKWITEPAKPSIVDEENSITLRWTYNMDGKFRSAEFRLPPAITIALKDNSGLAVNPAYSNRTQGIISDNETTITLIGVDRSDSGRYQFQITNRKLEFVSSEVEIEVQYQPHITRISGNQLVKEKSKVILNCTADGNPTPNITWTRLSDNSVVTFPLTITGKQDEGVYECTADNGIGTPATAVVSIVVEHYHPIQTNVMTDLSGNTVTANTYFNIICSAQANPPAKYRFYREQESLFNTSEGGNAGVYKTSVSARINKVIYSCIPFNDYGDGPPKMITIEVHYLPVIATAPSAQQVTEGNGATLFCNATANPPPSTAWTKQGSNTVLSSSETLSLTNLMRGDNGAVYKCKVENNLGSAEAYATIIVLFEPSATVQQCFTPVTEGDNATLHCNATGNPAPSIAWIRASTREVVAYNEVLSLEAITRSESGSYECLAFNGIGNNSTKSCTIDVHYSPEIVIAPSAQQLVEGDGATLFCNGTGNPWPNMSWTKQGSNTVLSSSETLILANVTGEDNGAVYKCKLQNNLGSAEANTTITVLFKPRATIQQCPTPIIEGDNATLFCNVTGNPAPNITWIRKSTREVVAYTEILSLEAITRNEIDSYECLTWNGIGDDSAKSCTIDVHYPPEIFLTPPAQQVVEGSGATLFCNATGNPPPSIAWTKQGSDTVLSSSETLPLTNLTRRDNGAVYKCKVKNNIGSAESNATVTVLSPPSVSIQQCSTPVIESKNARLYCNATGNPVPNITWIKGGEVLSHTKMLAITNISRSESGSYECLAWNGIGKNGSKSCTIDVHFRPEITKPHSDRWNVMFGDSVIAECLADASPTAQYVWKNETVGVVSNDRYLRLNNVDDIDGGNYTCTAANILGSDNFTILVKVTRTRITCEISVEKLNGSEVEYQAEYNNLNSESARAFVAAFEKGVNTTYANKSSYSKVEVIGLRNGSVIVSFRLFFTMPVSTNEGVGELRNAVGRGTIGPYTVSNLKVIKEVMSTTAPYSTSSVITSASESEASREKKTITSTDTTNPSATPPSTSNTLEEKAMFSTPTTLKENSSSDGPRLSLIIGTSVGGGVVAVIAVVVVIVVIVRQRY